MRQATGDRKPMPPAVHRDDLAPLGYGARRPRFWPSTATPIPTAWHERAGTSGKLACPALILWGDRDIYFPTRFAQAYAEALPAAELEVIPAAGHWPWIDDVRVIDRDFAFSLLKRSVPAR